MKSCLWVGTPARSPGVGHAGQLVDLSKLYTPTLYNVGIALVLPLKAVGGWKEIS